VRKISGLYGDDVGLGTNPNFYEPGALLSRRQAVRQHGAVRLPPMDIARRLFAAQYTYIGTIFFFTDPDAFENLLLEAYRHGSAGPDTEDREACLAYAKVLMILAFGQLYSINQWVDFRGPPGFEYFSHALALLPDAHEEGSISCVETLAYVGYFMQNMNRWDAAFLYIGMALRMAISLGLHQEVATHGLTDAEREYRRRVWWSIYSLDRILSAKSGNPSAIQDDDIGVAMPGRLASEPEYCPAVVLRHYTELSRILGEITSNIYRRTPGREPQSGSRLMESVKSIILSLSKWHANLPAELRFDPAKLALSRESVSTFLHYYQCINMTARPLLFHVVQKRLRAAAVAAASNAHHASVSSDNNNPLGEGEGDEQDDWKAELSTTTVKVIEMCLSAAQDTIHMMTLAAQRDLVATYGYMDGEHAFSAAIVLVMVCGAFPRSRDARAVACSRAMHAGLALLRGMGQRGNSHMGARYELLEHLRAILMPEEGPAAAAVDESDIGVFGTPASSSASMGSGVSPGPGAEWRISLLDPALRGDMPMFPVAATNTGLPETMLLSPLPGLGAAGGAAPGGYRGGARVPPPMGPNLFAFGGGAELPHAFPLVDDSALGDLFSYDVSMSSVAGDDDFGLWEEGFADPAGYDFSQWTQAARMAVDQQQGEGPM